MLVGTLTPQYCYPQKSKLHKQNLFTRHHIPVRSMFTFTFEVDREDDGRWIAEVPELPGVMVYGHTREEAVSLAEALALRVLADQIEEQAASRSELAMTVSFASA